MSYGGTCDGQDELEMFSSNEAITIKWNFHHFNTLFYFIL